MTLTVERLRQFIEDLPDDMLIQIDFSTTYDSYACEKSGAADDCLITHQGKLIISGSDRKVDY